MAAEVQPESDTALNASDRTEETCENGTETEIHPPNNDENHKSCENVEEHQKSWSLERNWGFTLEELFRLALKFFKEMNGKAFNPTYEENLRLVALHKQITFGPYNPKECPEIGFFDVLGNDRRKEWLRLGSMAREDAMEDFVKLLNSCCGLFAPYVASHKIEKEEQERRQREEEERLRLEREEQERQQLEEEARRKQEEERREREEEQRRKEEAERSQIEQQKQQIMAALNAQTAVQFQQYSKQQYPDNPEQQHTLIKQLQEQHYQQYVQQALRLQQQMALQKQQENSGVTQTPEAPSRFSSDAASTCNPSNQSISLENQEQQTNSKAFHLCVEGKPGETLIVAPSMWTRPQIREFKEKVMHDEDSVITVGRGEMLTVRVPTHEDGSHLFWEFATDHYDIGFGLYFEWKDLTMSPSNNNEGTSATETKEGTTQAEGEKELEENRLPLINEVVPVCRRDSHEEVYAGSHQYPGQGVYLLKFDNSYSFWRPKVVYYRVYYTR
ncbi:Golgi resident protein GCP60-like [Myxocyprinus asiaticus]|uniref:Golgi resident protein GCP60-like n=1 Tax=Myxocyprinus asiaticus TaxID=70543 RepID=UPI00222197BF|nr:Golgi resident protein GCP60-like [Myxocyprinus asiaticus]